MQLLRDKKMALLYRSIMAGAERIEVARPDSNLSAGGLTFAALSGGAFTSVDDGFYTNPFNVGQFYMNGTLYTQAFAGTNGIISFGSGNGGQFGGGTNPLIIAGNSGDQWLQPGVSLTNGYVQGFWTASVSFTNDGVTCYRTVIISNNGQYGNISQPRGFTMSLWRWGSRQFVTVRLRYLSTSNLGIQAGPGNSAGSVGTLPSTAVNQVWTSTNNGVTWTYLGTGDIAVTGPQLPATNFTTENLVNNAYYMVSDWGGDQSACDAATRSIAYNGLTVNNRLQSQILSVVVGLSIPEPLNSVLNQTDPTTGRVYGDLSENGGITDLNDSIVAIRLLNLPYETAPVTAGNRAAAARLGQRLRDVNFQLAAANNQIWVMGQGNMKRQWSDNNLGYTFSMTINSTGGFLVWGGNSSGSSTYQSTPMWSKGWNAGVGGGSSWQLSAPSAEPWRQADSTNGGPATNDVGSWVGHGSCQGGIFRFNQQASGGQWFSQAYWN